MIKKNKTVQNRILNSIKYTVSYGLFPVLLLLCVQSKAEDTDKIIEDFKTSLGLVSQYDYGKSHAWLDEFQKIMARVYNNPQIYGEIESLMVDGLSSDASPAAKQMICNYLGPLASGKSVSILKDMAMDVELSSSALSVLQQIPDQAADKALLELLPLADGKVQQGIINVLAKRKSPEAVDPLEELIFEDDPNISTAAVFALGQIGSKEACSILAKAFVKSESSLKWDIGEAWLICADKMSRIRTKEAFQIYVKVYEAGAPASLRYSALRGIINCDPAYGQSQLNQLLESEDNEMQTLVIPLIYDMDIDLSDFLAVMPQLDEYQQMQLFTVLGDKHFLAVKDYVKEAVAHENPDIRLAALMALRNIATAQDVEFLAEVASGARGRERDMARECLAIIKGVEFDQKITEGLKNEDPLIRRECVRSIGERNMKDAVGPVMETLGDTDRRVRLESYKVLGKLAGPEKLREIIDISINASSSAERNEAERTITSIALKITDEDERAVDILAVLGNVKDDAVLGMLIESMGNIGSGNALPVLEGYLNHENPDIRIAAIKALSVWPDAAPINVLKQVVESTEDVKAHNLALQGYIRMIQINDKMTEDQKFEACKYAYGLASTLEEKKLVISGLSDVTSIGAFEMATGLLEDPELQSEAKAAIASMAGSLGRIHSEYTKTELRKLVNTTDDPKFKMRLEEILKWMN
jgi:HEAT repeat protein